MLDLLRSSIQYISSAKKYIKTQSFGALSNA